MHFFEAFTPGTRSCLCAKIIIIKSGSFILRSVPTTWKYWQHACGKCWEPSQKDAYIWGNVSKILHQHHQKAKDFLRSDGRHNKFLAENGPPKCPRDLHCYDRTECNCMGTPIPIDVEASTITKDCNSSLQSITSLIGYTCSKKPAQNPDDTSK